MLTSPGTKLVTPKQLKENIKSVYDWHAIPIANGNDKLYFYIG